jgi:hypothetical protein
MASSPPHTTPPLGAAELFRCRTGASSCHRRCLAKAAASVASQASQSFTPQAQHCTTHPGCSCSVLPSALHTAWRQHSNPPTCQRCGMRTWPQSLPTAMQRNLWRRWCRMRQSTTSRPQPVCETCTSHMCPRVLVARIASMCANTAAAFMLRCRVFAASHREGAAHHKLQGTANSGVEVLHALHIPVSHPPSLLPNSPPTFFPTCNEAPSFPL